jgi:hypothetical protein
MKLNVFNYPVSTVTGIIAVLVFTLLTFISVSLYPMPYNPLYDWLSNLGNSNLNPSGAFFFNFGCIISGLFLIPFFLGLYTWKPLQRINLILLISGILLGIYASISFIMVGIYPETHIQQHMMAATGVFGTLFIIIILISLALYRDPKFMHIIAFYGLTVIIIDLLFQYFLSIDKYLLGVFHPSTPVPGLEWTVVFSSMGWILLLAINMGLRKRINN